MTTIMFMALSFHYDPTKDCS